VNHLCFIINYKNNGWIQITRTMLLSKPCRLSMRKWSLIYQPDRTILSKMSLTSMMGWTNRDRLRYTVTGTKITLFTQRGCQTTALKALIRAITQPRFISRPRHIWTKLVSHHKGGKMHLNRTKTKILINECSLSKIWMKIGSKRWKRRNWGKRNRKRNMRFFWRRIMNRFFHRNIKLTVSFRSIMTTSHYFQNIMPHNILQTARKLNLIIKIVINSIMNFTQLMKLMKKVQTKVKEPVQIRSRLLRESMKLSLRMRQEVREVLHLLWMLNTINLYFRWMLMMIRNRICLDLASHAQEGNIMSFTRLRLPIL